MRSASFVFKEQAWFEWSVCSRGCLMVELEAPNGTRVAVLNVPTTSGPEDNTEEQDVKWGRGRLGGLLLEDITQIFPRVPSMTQTELSMVLTATSLPFGLAPQRFTSTCRVPFWPCRGAQRRSIHKQP